MDPRRFLIVVATIPFMGGCALLDRASADVSPIVASSRPTDPAPPARPPLSPPPSAPPSDADTARPYLDAGLDTPAQPDPSPDRRTALSAANAETRAASPADGVIGAVQVFGWSEGRVYEIRTAPLRVTALTLARGETVTAKAAGDTVRWQIGEGVSGQGPSARTHVLVKPLQSGLETNLILTTNQRVYLLTLRSGPADAFNAAVAWDYGDAAPALSHGTGGVPVPPPPDLSVVTPQGPLDARYRIDPRGRAPRWTPTAVFTDGTRTFIALPPEVAVNEAPALFIQAGGETQLVNYRQAGNLLIVDRVFEAAELRLGDRRPQIVHIRRLPGDPR